MFNTAIETVGKKEKELTYASIRMPDFYNSGHFDSESWEVLLRKYGRLKFYDDSDGSYSYGYVEAEEAGFSWKLCQERDFEVHEKGPFDLFLLHYHWSHRNKPNQRIDSGSRAFRPEYFVAERFNKLCHDFMERNRDARIWIVDGNKRIPHDSWDIKSAAFMKINPMDGQINFRYCIEPSGPENRHDCIVFNQLLEFVLTYGAWDTESRYLCGNEYFKRSNVFNREHRFRERPSQIQT